jgi:hypothetical protein
VEVTEPGNYYVTFSDARGHLATIKFTVSSPPTATETTATPTENATGTPPATVAPFPLVGTILGLSAAAALSILKERLEKR